MTRALTSLAVLLSLAAAPSALAEKERRDPPAAAPPGAAPSAAPPAAGPPQDVPDTPEIRAEVLKDLYTHLGQARDADTAAAIAARIESLWLVSGSDTVDLLMQRSFQAMSERKFDLALTLLTTVVELQPDYAEAWNRRAFVHHQLQNTERALGDLRRTLALEPNHYKAMEGLANILRQEGSKKAALEIMRKVKTARPFMKDIDEAIAELTREVEGQGI